MFLKTHTMKKNVYYMGVCLLTASLFSCKGEIEKTEPGKETNTEAKENAFVYQSITPQSMPDLGINGFNFPEDSVVLNKWIHDGKNDSIHLHGWGIWTGLTSNTDIKVDGEESFLRVFETWMTPEEMITDIKSDKQLFRAHNRSNRANLKRPHQFSHFASDASSVNDSIHESVSYNPSASEFAIENKIFMATTLYDLSQSKKEITFFPNDAITIKPVFKLLNASSGETTFNIAAWNGTTDELIGFPEKDWNSYVTIDVKNTSSASNGVFPVSDFIHYKLNKEDAYFFNKEFSENAGNKFNAKPGDIAVLVGMHVGTREITNWTWQTFWWSKTPDAPNAPSSTSIANIRPDELKGAARHYAMSVAYFMVNPNEPTNGTNIEGETLYAFNPYLEAGFGPDVFDKDISYVNTKNGKVNTYAGVRTNCMSCHRMATVNPDKLGTSNPSKTPYVGNSFVSKNDSLFNGQLLLDFAWSIEGNLDTTGLYQHINK